MTRWSHDFTAEVKAVNTEVDFGGSPLVKARVIPKHLSAPASIARRETTSPLFHSQLQRRDWYANQLPALDDKSPYESAAYRPRSDRRRNRVRRQPVGRSSPGSGACGQVAGGRLPSIAAALQRRDGLAARQANSRLGL